MEEPSIGLKEAINGITVNQMEDLNLPSGNDVLQSVINYNNSDLKQVVRCVGASRAWARAPPALVTGVCYYAQHSALEISNRAKCVVLFNN